MVKPDWIEKKLSQYEAKRLQDQWTKENEKQFQYLLELYRTGNFQKYTYNQINAKLHKITKITK